MTGRRPRIGDELHEAEGQPWQLWLASVGLGLLDADDFGDLETAVAETVE